MGGLVGSVSSNEIDSTGSLRALAQPKKRIQHVIHNNSSVVFIPAVTVLGLHVTTKYDPPQMHTCSPPTVTVSANVGKTSIGSVPLH
jgi:hypothetical protein